MKASAKDLRLHTKELLDAVTRGEEVVVTHRGKPCAKLVPISTQKIGKDKPCALFGIWKDYAQSDDVDGYVRQLRQGRQARDIDAD